MAKSARASVVKRNNRTLRAKVYTPVCDARTERLSAKLRELAAKPRVNPAAGVEVDPSKEAQDQAADSLENSPGMDVDDQGAKTEPVKTNCAKTTKSGRIEKKIAKRKQAKNSIVFASVIAKKRRMAAMKNKR